MGAPTGHLTFCFKDESKRRLLMLSLTKSRVNLVTVLIIYDRRHMT